MNTKLQELTDKIYTEGVEKGKAEASDIIAKAEAQAKEIIAAAQRQAATIIKEAEQSNAELEKNTRSELQLFAGQTINSLKTDITNLICGSIVSDSVHQATADKAFLQQTIGQLVLEWAKNDSIMVEAQNAEALTRYFESQAKDLLNSRIIVKASRGKSEFVIEPKNGGYKVTFGDEEFIAYFKEFLRPKLIEMLF